MNPNEQYLHEWGTKPAYNKGSAYVGCKPNHKRCPTCEEQPLSAFGTDKRTWDKLNSICKACIKERYGYGCNEAKRRWYQRNKSIVLSMKYTVDLNYKNYLIRLKSLDRSVTE